MTRTILRGAAVFAALLLLPAPASAQVRDTVVLRSGNPVIGEVQFLRRGSLSFDTDEMDVVKIDWDDIALLRSPAFFEVHLTSGRRLFGSLASAGTARLVVVGAARADTVPFQSVVEIDAIEKSFFARTNGFIDVGTNLARANRLASLLVKGRFNYRGPKWGFEITPESYWQRQQTVSDAGDTTTSTTSRNSATLAVNRQLTARWAVVGSGQAEQNTELELDLRLLGQLGGSYHFVRSQGLEVYIGAGASLNVEQYTGQERNNSGEALVVLGFDAFDVGDVDLYTNVTTYTNPFDGGRFRVNVDARIAWEIFNDFTVGLNVTERFDSQPPSDTAPKRDYQYAFSIGWSWS
ncbi:MAG: DUF481 domain-containing protein [Gemmatimonadota bacterium]|nr:MAG: DUF481 domain-containing protein [Gemmatimonadota bacterium]